MNLDHAIMITRSP